jgi:ATP-dependent DNA helicase RecG
MQMFLVQKKRRFPLPEYNFSNNQVEVTIIGKILDMNYTKILEEKPDLSLSDVIVLDKLQKKKKLTEQEANRLNNEKLLGSKEQPDMYKFIILEYLNNSSDGLSREEIDGLLMNALPSSLNREQKNTKIHNLLSAMQKDNLIENVGTRKHSLWKKKYI